MNNKITRLRKYAEKLEKRINEGIAKFEDFTEKIGYKADAVEQESTETMELISSIGTNLYTVARFLSLPFSIWWFIKELLAERKKTNVKLYPMFNQGNHYVWGRPGKGKSTFVYYYLIDSLKRYGKSAYTSEQMELPRLNNRGELTYLFQHIDLKEVWNSGSQISGFDGNWGDKVVIEEALRVLNHRNNKEKKYNDIALGIVETLVSERHQYLWNIIMISQMDTADTQFMRLFNDQHEPIARFMYSFKTWFKTGVFKREIKGWRVYHRDIIPTGNNSYIFRNNRSYYVKNEYPEEMEYFNRLNMKKHYENLPKIKLGGKL